MQSSSKALHNIMFYQNLLIMSHFDFQVAMKFAHKVVHKSGILRATLGTKFLKRLSRRDYSYARLAKFYNRRSILPRSCPISFLLHSSAIRQFYHWLLQGMNAGTHSKPLPIPSPNKWEPVPALPSPNELETLFFPHSQPFPMSKGVGGMFVTLTQPLPSPNEWEARLLPISSLSPNRVLPPIPIPPHLQGVGGMCVTNNRPLPSPN